MVTVFGSSKAEVVRVFNSFPLQVMSLKHVQFNPAHAILLTQQGRNKIEIKGLSSSIDPQSIRVSGLGHGCLLDVACTVEAFKSGHYAPGTNAEKLRALEVEKDALESEKRVREHEADLLIGYSKSLNGEHVAPAQMVRAIGEKIIGVDRLIAAEKNKTASKKGSAHGRVTIIIGSEAKASVNLKLAYIVGDAQWRPAYELHATTKNGKPSPAVSLHYLARITQSTGEDWADTALTLSTVSPDTNASIPELSPVKVTPQYKENPLFGSKPATGTAPQQQQKQQTTVTPSLFGGGFGGVSATQQPQTTATSSLFGGGFGTHQPFGSRVSATQQQSATAAHGIFGEPQPAMAAPSLFGSGVGAPQQQSATATHGLFGVGAPQPATAAHGLFDGGIGALQQQPATATHGLFGGGVGAPQQQQRGSLFSSFGSSIFDAANQRPAPAKSLFGFPSTLPSAPRFGVKQGEEESCEQVSAPGPVTNAESSLKTTVTETPVTISYSVHGASTIPSDGVEHQATVAILQFKSTISHITTPRADSRVYLQCEVKNTSEYRLLPGLVSVILDDSYISKTPIQAVNTGDWFNCTLGDDVSTQVTYSRIPRVMQGVGGTFAELFNATTYITRISIYNKHQSAISDLRVRDIIPTCEDKRVRVVLITPESLANAKEGQEVNVRDGLIVKWRNEKEGRFEWKWKVGSGEKVTIDAEWEVRVPTNASWMDQTIAGNL
ncbi:hypothetical protein BD779DRAFT_1709096 [Infundibulicybe gibba]|nr:hypothetical protein BD779DRAFT_1709096 [Infundibulicybe gibba]